jgi:outer membrane protein assembly factor BamB
MLQSLAGTDVAPGEERVMSSPVVLGLIAALVVLVLLSAGLWRTIGRRSADNQFQRAVTTYQEGDYLNATKLLERFLQEHPEDARAGRARVLGALSGVRQYAAGAAPAWSEAHAAARKMLSEHQEDAAFEDIRAELTETLLRTTEGLAERAARTADPRTLGEAEAALTLTRQVAGPAAESLESRSRAPAKLASARAAVRKGVTRLAALKAMDQALQAGSAAGIYEARDALVAEYPDLAADSAVVERLTRGNDLLRQAVTFDPTTRAGETTPRPDPLGPPTTLVLRGVGDGRADPAAPTVVALAEGLALGLSESDGAPRWQVPVGLSAPFPPQLVGGDPPSVLVVDARYHDLFRLDARDGRLLWRQELGERVTAPPLVLGNDLFQVVPSGKVLRINLATGELRGTLNCQRELAATPVADELGAHLYVAGDRANLFILARDPLGCVGVEYLGHDSGSVPCAPTRVGRYLVLPINDTLSDGYWRVLLLEQDGAKVRPVQRLPVSGWTWNSPASHGSVIWSVGDRGGLTAYAIGAETERVPFQKVAEIAPDPGPSGPAFAFARSERELWLSSGHSGRRDLLPERGKIDAVWSLVDAGPALAPIQFAGRFAVFTQQPVQGRGVTLWGIDPADGSIAWHTAIGASWPVPLTTANGSLATLGVSGQPLPLPWSELESGGFIEQALPGPGDFRLPPGPLEQVDVGANVVIVPRPGTDRLLIGRGTSALGTLDLPAALAAPPVPWGEGLIVAGIDGMVYWINPQTGGPLADPFVPPFDRERPTRWMTPAVITGEAFVLADTTGRLRKVVRKDDSRSRLVLDDAPVDLGSPPAAPPVANQDAVILATTDGNVRALSARDLSPVGSWPLPGPLTVGPTRAGDYIVTIDISGHVLALGPDGVRAWSAELGAPPAGPPAAWGDALWFLDNRGILHGLAVASGAEVERSPLNLLPAGGPISGEGGLVVPSGPGSLRVWRPGTTSSPEGTP